MSKLCGIAAAMILSSGIFAQDYLAKHEYFFSLNNRLDLLVSGDTSARALSLAIAFRSGSFNERAGYDGLSFLYEYLLRTRLQRQLMPIIPSESFSITGETSYEYVLTQMTFPKQYLERTLQVIYEAVSAPFSDEEIKDAVRYANSEYALRMKDAAYRLEQQIGAILWEDDFRKRTIISTWDDSTAALIPMKIAKLREEYFCPRNCIIVIKGNVVQKTVHEMVRDAFVNWERCKLNPFTKFPAPNYRTIINSVQLVDENPASDTPFYRIAFPGPNTFEDKRSNYCALVLRGIISSPASRIHSLLYDSCGLASATLNNDLARHISQITFNIIPVAEKVGFCYECIRAFLVQTGDSLIDERELSIGKDSVISNFDKAQSDLRNNVSQIIHFWASLSLNDYSTFEDSIRSVTLEEMRQLFDRYFRKRPYVAGLSISPAFRKSTMVDTAFTATEKTIRNYKLTFLKNSAIFSGAKDDSTLNSVIQYLKINPEMVIKVNGVCHKDELLQVSDKAMLQWVRSFKGFIMNPTSLISKKKFRLDVYRSLTVIKKLHEAGIDKTRLFGTGNLVRTPGEEEKYRYVYFTQVIE